MKSCLVALGGEAVGDEVEADVGVGAVEEAEASLKALDGPGDEERSVTEGPFGDIKFFNG